MKKCRATNACSFSAKMSAFTAARFKVTEGLQAKYGETRVIDTPISEIAIVGAACGAALMGMRPVAEFQFMDFISCAFDIITNYAAKLRYRDGQGCPIVLRGPCGGNVHGGAVSFAEPGGVLYERAGPQDRRAFDSLRCEGLAESRDPRRRSVIFLEHKYLYRMARLKAEVATDDYIVPIGKAAVRREGKHLSIITYGAMCYIALDAADKLAQGRHRSRSH